MVAWRVADSLGVLLKQINQLAPGRSKVSDGSIGDAAHQSRESDHNPWVLDPPGPNVVTARDFTHDPKNGADMAVVSEALRRSKDPRIKYCIFNGRIFSSYPVGGVPAWTWRKYTGSNPHKTHMHLSVLPEKRLYDNLNPWQITLGPPPEKDVNMAIPEKYHKTLIDLAYAVQHRNSHGSALGFLIDDARKDIITRDELNAAVDEAVKKAVNEAKAWTNTKIAGAVAGGVSVAAVIEEIVRRLS